MASQGKHRSVVKVGKVGFALAWVGTDTHLYWHPTHILAYIWSRFERKRERLSCPFPDWSDTEKDLIRAIKRGVKDFPFRSNMTLLLGVVGHAMRFIYEQSRTKKDVARQVKGLEGAYGGILMPYNRLPAKYKLSTIRYAKTHAVGPIEEYDRFAASVFSEILDHMQEHP